MTAQLIPVTPGEVGQTFSVQLAGDVFRLDFRYNDRDNRIYMSVFDEDDDPIIVGVRLVRGGPVMPLVVDVRRPFGDFFVRDVGANAEPNLANFGIGIELVFVPFAA